MRQRNKNSEGNSIKKILLLSSGGDKWKCWVYGALTGEQKDV